MRRLPLFATRDVHAIGNAIVDLQVQVEHSFLRELRLEPGSMTLVDHGRQAEVLAALAGQPVNSCSGGSAANTIAGVAELGGRASFCGKVGNDEYGSFYIEDLQRLGVAMTGNANSSAVSGGSPTGTCVVLITPDAQRTMLTHLGASSQLAPDDIDGEAVAAAKWCYVEGYLLPGEPTRQAALHAMGLAREAGAQIALTASDAFCVRACPALFWELLEDSVDLFFCNEAEGRALTGLQDPLEVASHIHERAKSSVALTYGANGSLLIHENRPYPIEGVDVHAVDTTGAGDMYAAGILFGITRGMSWPAAGRLASHAAARIVGTLGARLPRKFTADEIRALSGA